MKTALGVIGGLIAVILLGWILQANNYVNFAFWAPKYENVRRNTFENTQSYVQGKIQDLSNYKLQYSQAKDTDTKQGIQSVIRTQFANFDINQCPEELKPFLQEMRGY
jgi:hypothetical protein